MICCFFGDSLTLGYGDETGLGWAGRVGKAVCAARPDATVYNLGVRRNAAPLLQHRWRAEAMPRRMEGESFKLVFSFGVADVFTEVAVEESLAAGVSILTQAKEMGDVLVVGPLPANDREKREALVELSRLQATMCKRLDIPFVSVIDAMHRSFVYGQALNDGDGVHPVGAGYADLAEHILNNDLARAFFGLEKP